MRNEQNPRGRFWWPLTVAIVWLLAATASFGHPTNEQPEEVPDPDRPRIYEEVDVEERVDDLVGIADSAGEGVTGRADLQRRPIQRPGDVLETTPGMVATQHSGGGKSNQYFLRGFNLDHGTDFSVRVAGVPANQPSHGHGQGYTDLNFLIPEMVSRLRYRKGPYHAGFGDFSAAGSADMELLNELPTGLLSATIGSWDAARLLWADSFETAAGQLLVAAEGSQSNGPWTREDDYDTWKGLVRHSQGDAERSLAITAMGYDADWLSTDQVPRRLVDSGQIGRFDLVDEGPRGFTRRFSVGLEARQHRGRTFDALDAYLVHVDFGLVSNFTYFLEDEVDGDQFEQRDRRLIAGFDLRRSYLGSLMGKTAETSVGFGLRFDDIDNGLFRTSDLQRLGTVRTDTISQLGGGPWVESTVRWAPKVRTRLGLRADAFYADVDSDLAVNSGSADDFLLSPKASLILGPWNRTEFYFNYGRGFHSNDARGATIRVDPVSLEPAAPVDPLVRAEGYDVGLRSTAIKGLHTTLTLFVLELDSELVFVGDGGATEPNGATRRFGVEWTNAWTVAKRLKLDLDITLTDASFTDEPSAADEIPGAVGTTVAAGVTWDDKEGVFGGLRWRYFGDVPLIEDGSVEWGSSSLLNGRLGYRFANGLELRLEGFNLLDRQDSDIEYFYASRLPAEPSGGFEDVHFHPLQSRSVQLVTTWRP